ncbi:hypothetical protein B7G68_19305 [Caulobacter segnis]|uniref:Integral membrane protein-like protein n=2 Tax=Caulobacter segnis TaxID=88688 RepID=D5VNX5_CAUST|nr:hypothetical protein [Caulobacter segnis]ADG12198.1 integral membrane protein-like protein [Caulobacter segnis ATCC 21756]AVQ03796.1 hypothetical protein B7G68_19305 [Caulobacter segnis]
MTTRSSAQNDPPIWIVALILLAASFAPLSHALWAGLAPIDSYNSIWVESFGAALRRGEFPPRWIPEGFHGLGGSSFYFYPPLFFYVAAGVDLLTGGLLNAEQVTAWACLVLSLAGSLGLYAWMRPHAGGRVALVAGAVYAVAPYHLLDAVSRGSLGELAVYAVLPFFALSLERAARHPAWIPPLALSLAGMILGHIAVALPICLIAAPIAALWLIMSAEPMARLAIVARLAAGAILGAGLAMTYLLPALALQDAASMKFMWGPPLSGADPAAWTLLNAKHWPPAPLAGAMAWLGWTYGAAALGVLAVLGRASGPRTAAARVWAAVCLVAIAAYATPAVWHGPLAPILGKMQFPFRMLVMVEFALIAAASLAFSHRPRLVVLLAAVVAVSVWVPVKQTLIPAFERARLYPAGQDPTIAQRIRVGRLPEEHLPGDFFFDPAILVDRVYLSGYERLPLVRPLDPAAKVLAATSYPDGSLAVRLDAPRPTRVVVRRFYFPAWRADLVQAGEDPGVAISSTGPSRILTFAATPGDHVYRLHIVRTPVEKLGDAIALASLAAIGLIGFATRQRRGAPGGARQR